MFSILIGTVIFASAMAIERTVYNIDEVEHLFDDFIKKYEKVYTTDEEKLKRNEIFTENLQEINRLNSMGSSLRVVSKFTDLTTQEFVKQFTGFSIPDFHDGAENCAKAGGEDIQVDHIPDSFNYRDLGIVTPVKNQRPCGSCWAFAATAAIESQYAKHWKTVVSLSEQQIIDCTIFNKHLGHCDLGGYAEVAFFELIRTKRGLALEQDYPYQGKDQLCQIIDPDKFSVKVVGCTKYLLTEDKLKEALLENGPLVVNVDASSWQHYGGLVHNATDCTNYGLLNHAALLVGYGTTMQQEDFWLIKNSWGPEFGEEGYIKISRGENACGIVDVGSVGVEVAKPVPYI